LLGVCWVLGGEQGLHLDEITRNIVSSPLSYALAFAGAFIWAAYCTVTSKFAKGQNGITLFVLLTALSLWVKYFLSDQPEMVFTLPVVVKLVMCGIALGFGYAAWNIGILHGNVTVLAAVSYFTPVLRRACRRSAEFAPLILVLARRADGLRRVVALLVRHKKIMSVFCRGISARQIININLICDRTPKYSYDSRAVFRFCLYSTLRKFPPALT
jgi:hypothetical protein